MDRWQQGDNNDDSSSGNDDPSDASDVSEVPSSTQTSMTDIFEGVVQPPDPIETGETDPVSSRTC